MKLKNIETRQTEEINENDAMIEKALNFKIYDFSDGKYIFMNDVKIKINDEIINFLEMIEDKDIDVYTESGKIIIEDEEGEEHSFDGKEMSLVDEKGNERRYGFIYNFEKVFNFVKNI